MAATNAQVQNWADTRTRVRAEQIRALYLACKDDAANIGDVYANLTNSPTWTDQRTDNPPHLLVPSDVLALNTVVNEFVKFIEGTFTDLADANSAHGQYPVVESACVHPINL